MEYKKYNQLRFIFENDPNEILRIREEITRMDPRNMSEIRDKQILRLYFIDLKSAREISNMNKFKSRKGGYISSRQINNIVNQYFPGLMSKRYKPEDLKRAVKNRAYRESTAYKRKFNPNQCCKCGACGEVDIHHMFPVFLGGFSHPLNMMPLCESCHSEITKFLQENKDKIIENFIRYNHKDILKLLKEMGMI